MNNMVATFNRCCKRRRIAKIALNHLQVRADRQTSGTEKHEIINNDLIAGVEKLRDKNTAFVARASRN